MRRRSFLRSVASPCASMMCTIIRIHLDASTLRELNVSNFSYTSGTYRPAKYNVYDYSYTLGRRPAQA